MLARLTRPVTCHYDRAPVPAGTIGTVRRTLGGGLVFRLRCAPRTIAVQPGDFEAVAVDLPPLPPEPLVARRALSAGSVITPASRTEVADAPAWVQSSDDYIAQHPAPGVDSRLEVVVACAAGMALALVLAFAWWTP